MVVLWPDGSASQAPPRVSSEFGMRTHPVTGAPSTMHYGIDLVGWSLIKSPCNGTIIFAGYNGGAGNEVRIRADNGDVFRLLHNKSFIRTGGRVAQGENVAVMGTTGSSTGVHCHEETRPGGGNAINPRTYYNLANAGTPAGGGGTPLPTPEEDMQFDNQNRIYWPNGYFNSYRQDVFNALKYWHDNGKEQPGTEGTVVREVWAANNFMTAATAKASADATVAALKASGIPVSVDLDDLDTTKIANDVVAKMPKPADRFEVSVVSAK